jgi:hypothetical protein
MVADSLKPAGEDVENLHLVLPQSPKRSESQVHIDYRGGLGHFGKENDNVLENKGAYKDMFGSYPPLIP